MNFESLVGRINIIQDALDPQGLGAISFDISICSKFFEGLFSKIVAKVCSTSEFFRIFAAELVTYKLICI